MGLKSVILGGVDNTFLGPKQLVYVDSHDSMLHVDWGVPWTPHDGHQIWLPGHLVGCALRSHGSPHAFWNMEYMEKIQEKCKCWRQGSNP